MCIPFQMKYVHKFVLKWIWVCFLAKHMQTFSKSDLGKNLFYIFKFKFVYFNWRLITLQCCIGFPYINMNPPQVIGYSDRACQTPHHLSCLDLGRAQNAGPTKSLPLRTTRLPEPERLRPERCMQQPTAWAVWAGRAHAPWARAGPLWLRHCEHTPVLFVCIVPPSSEHNWTSEP